MAHAVLVERVRQVAVSDRQAQITAAMVLRAEDYAPIDVDAQVADWESWLVRDPGAQKPGESFADRVARFEQQVQALDQMTEVA